jgi:pseudouridine synthase
MARARTDGDGESSSRVRLQRVLADAGVAARRVCEALIEAGRVSVNGEVVRRLPVFVSPESDDIRVDGLGVRRAERRMYLMVNKPERFLVTNADEPHFDRPTVMHLIDHPSVGRLFPVGRLDYESAGLVLLTNDGDLTNTLTHPRYGVTKTYEALVKGSLDSASVAAIPTKLRALAKREARDAGPGARVKTSGGEFELAGPKGANTLLRIRLRESRNRELREVLRLLGMPLKKLTRTAIGPLELKGLAPGRWRELTREEIQALRRAAKRSAGGRSPNQSGRPPRRRPAPSR